MNKILELYNQNNEFGKLFGMTYEVITPGNIVYKLKVTKQMLGTPTVIHGGALAGFMDAVIGVAALSITSEKGKAVSTVEFKVNYLRPIFLNDELKGIGTVLSEGKRIIVAKGEIFNQNNELVAISTATLNAYPLEKTGYKFP